MVQFLQNHMKNHREKTLHHLFSHLMASENKILWHTFLYGPKKLQEGFALFFFSFLSPLKETNNHRITKKRDVTIGLVKKRYITIGLVKKT